MPDPDTLIHLLAGGMGGTVGAILTCPLEVVKTRLQSSNSGFDNMVRVPDIADNKPANTTCKTAPASTRRNFWARPDFLTSRRSALGSQYTVNLLNGNSGHFGSTTPILYSTQSQPCRPVKTKLTAMTDRASRLVNTTATSPGGQQRGVHTVSVPNPQPPPANNMSVWACLKHIWVHEGPKGLFRGLGPNLVGVAPSRAIYFWSYSTSKRTINSRLPKYNRDTPFVHVLSAASAGFVSSCATNPIWLVKTRLQLDRSGGSVIPVITKIYRDKGLFGFWKGVTASWWGISETMIHFVIYEFLKKSLTEYQNKNKNSDKTFIDFAGFMLCGATSKTCATCVAYPHEVARTRMREAGHKYKSFWQTLFLVNREEGRKGLYRGLGTQLLRQIPNTAIMMATYESTVYLLTNYIKKKPSERAKEVERDASRSTTATPHSQ